MVAQVSFRLDEVYLVATDDPRSPLHTQCLVHLNFSAREFYIRSRLDEVRVLAIDNRRSPSHAQRLVRLNTSAGEKYIKSPYWAQSHLLRPCHIMGCM